MALKGIENQANMLPGAGEFYYGTSLASLIRFGGYKDAQVVSKRESSKIQLDNDSIEKYKNGDLFAFSFKLYELDPDVIAGINAGWITKTVVAGSLVSGATKVFASGDISAYLKIYEIDNGNSDQSLVTVASVVGSTDPTLVANTDYVLVKLANGKTGIYFKSGGAVSTVAQTFTVTYSYTPTARVDLSFNNTGIATRFYARFIHTRPDGKKVTIDLQNVQNLTPFTIDFVGNAEDDVASTDIELEGTITASGFKYEK